MWKWGFVCVEGHKRSSMFLVNVLSFLGIWLIFVFHLSCFFFLQFRYLCVDLVDYMIYIG